MKDLVFLLLTLGVIMFAMMFAQSQYYSREEEVNRQWKRDRHFPTNSPTPTPTTTPAVQRP